MPGDPETIKPLDAYPSLRGRFESKPVIAQLSELERQVLRYQGLLGEDGTISDEVVRKPTAGERIEAAGLACPVPLEALTPQAAEILDKVAEIKSAAAPPPDLPPTEGLAPPELDQPGEPAAIPPADGLGAEAEESVWAVIRRAAEPLGCPHCGYDIRQGFAEPRCTEEDKLAFIRHIFSDGRFYRVHPLCGGQLHVRLRSRTYQEAEMILSTARAQVAADPLSSAADLRHLVQRYSLAASIDRIGRTDAASPLGGEAKSFPTLSEVGEVKQLDEQVFGEGRASIFYNVMLAAWMEFESLYGWMAARAHDPDFWPAADGAPS